MKYLKKRLKNRNLILLLISDILMICSSFYLGALLRYEFILPESVIILFSPFYIISLLAIKILSFRFFALYRGMWRYTSIWDMVNILKGNIFATLIFTIYFYFFHGFEGISRSLFFIDFILSYIFISSSRLGIRIFFSNFYNFLKNNTYSSIKKNVILIGAGDTGQEIIKQSLEKSDSTISVVGVLDDDESKIGSRLHGIPVLGAIKNLTDFDANCDEIYICIPSATQDQLRKIVEECKKSDKVFKTLPSISELVQGKVSLSQFREVSILDLLGREEIQLDKTIIKKFIKGKRVLITGAGGSIGSELVRQCTKYKPSVLIMIDISELNLFEIDRETNSIKSDTLFKPILADIRDSALLEEIFSEFKPQVVFHAAAYKHVPIQEYFPWEAIKTNIFGTDNLIKCSKNFDTEKFVLVSTDKAVKPTNVMGATKRLAEMITQINNKVNGSKTEFMAVRFGNVLGSSGSAIPIFQEQIKKGGPLTITDPEMERYFMSIPEASQLILQAGSIGIGGEVFILDMGKPIKIIDIANELIRLSGYEPNLDIEIEFTGIRPGEKKIEELSLPTENLDQTKHDKIFVLNDNLLSLNEQKQILSDVRNLKENLSGKKASEVKSLLSSILPEYNPKVSKGKSIYIDIQNDAQS